MEAAGRISAPGCLPWYLWPCWRGSYTRLVLPGTESGRHAETLDADGEAEEEAAAAAVLEEDGVQGMIRHHRILGQSPRIQGQAGVQASGVVWPEVPRLDIWQGTETGIGTTRGEATTSPGEVVLGVQGQLVPARHRLRPRDQVGVRRDTRVLGLDLLVADRPHEMMGEYPSGCHHTPCTNKL
jgi:hypothetical protein